MAVMRLSSQNLDCHKKVSQGISCLGCLFAPHSNCLHMGKFSEISQRRRVSKRHADYEVAGGAIRKRKAL